MTEITLTGFEANYYIKNKKLKFLRPIIEQWLKINREYIEEYDYEDSLYSYNERSTISSLAGAVWRCGGYSQEEYIAEKGKDKKNGRIDLFFSFSNKEIIVEAKQKFIWLVTDSKKNLKKHISESLEDSVNDANETKIANAKEYGDFFIGITFIVPCWHKESNQEDNLKKIKSIAKDKDIGADIVVTLESKKDILFNEEEETVSNVVIMLCKVV